MFLYTNGDSFTAGSELADDIIPGWPGYRSNCSPDDPTFQRTQQWMYKVRRKKQFEEIVTLADATGRKFAWPQQLAGMLNCRHYNNAEGGSSFDRICRTTISDLIRLKKERRNITAIISITDVFRSEVPDARHPDLWETFDVKTIPDRDTPHYEIYHQLAKFKVLHETLFYRLWSFYWNALQVKNFCTLNNIKLFWLEVFPDGFYPHAEERTHPMLEPLIQEVDLNFLLSMSTIAMDSKEEYKYCPGGHFRKEIHTEIATELFTKLKGLSVV